MRIAPTAPRAHAGKALDNSRAAQLAQVCGSCGRNSHSLTARISLCFTFVFRCLSFPAQIVTAMAQAPPGNAFTTSASAPTASSAASTLPPAAAAASLPSFDSQDKPVLVFEDVCFNRMRCSCHPSLCLLTLPPTAQPFFKDGKQRSVPPCVLGGLHMFPALDVRFSPPSPLLQSHLSPENLFRAHTCNTLHMCNISGVRNKDPRRRCLSIASIAFCYLALVLLVR